MSAVQLAALKQPSLALSKAARLLIPMDTNTTTGLVRVGVGVGVEGERGRGGEPQKTIQQGGGRRVTATHRWRGARRCRGLSSSFRPLSPAMSTRPRLVYLDVCVCVCVCSAYSVRLLAPYVRSTQRDLHSSTPIDAVLLRACAFSRSVYCCDAVEPLSRFCLKASSS